LRADLLQAAPGFEFRREALFDALLRVLGML
jgi:hypothetical protein